jgi:hypothetical protein
MATANPNARVLSVGSIPVQPVDRLVELVCYEFELHAVLVREKFLLESVRREIDFREQTETESGARLVARNGEGINRWSSARRPLSAKDIRLHAWLSERLAVLHYERHGVWPKVRRFLFGNRLVRWLGLL